MVIKSNVEQLIRQQYGKQLFQTRIRSNIAIAEAQAQGMDVYAYDNKCNGAKDYDLLSKEVLAQHEPQFTN